MFHEKLLNQLFKHKSKHNELLECNKYFSRNNIKEGICCNESYDEKDVIIKPLMH